MNPLESLSQRMTPPSLELALRAGVVEVDGLKLVVQPGESWTVPGENQIASTAQFRLVEWNREVMQAAINKITPLDTRIAHLEADFQHEVMNNRGLVVNPVRITIRNTSITTKFTITQSGLVCSIFDLVQVAVETIDGKTVKKVIPPEVKTMIEFAGLILPDEMDIV